MNPRILFVDDEPNVLSAFQRSLRPHFAIDTAPDGREGLERLEQNGPYAVVVADMRMPCMDGLEFLQRAMTLSPDTVRVMLTGAGDQQTAMDAVNRGHVFRFLTKPCSDETLGLSLRSAVRQHRLILAERELLENTLNGSIQVLMDILSLTDPEAFGRSQTIRDYARHAAHHLELEHRWELELSAMLCNIGFVSVPPQLVQKLRGGSGLTGVEKDILARVPQVGSELLAHIPRLQGVARIVLYQNKHFDGTGFPVDRTRGHEIPVESRLLKILLDLTAEEARKVPAFRALSQMSRRAGWYDPDLLAAVIRCFGLEPASESSESSEDSSPSGTHAVTLAELRPGDVLQSDVITIDGLLIVGREARVTPLLLQRIRSFAELSGICEPIRIATPASLPLRPNGGTTKAIGGR